MTALNDNRSLMHDEWIGTFEAVLEQQGISTVAGECAWFCAEVLRRCGDTSELKAFLDERSLKAYEAHDGNR